MWICCLCLELSNHCSCLSFSPLPSTDPPPPSDRKANKEPTNSIRVAYDSIQRSSLSSEQNSISSCHHGHEINQQNHKAIVTKNPEKNENPIRTRAYSMLQQKYPRPAARIRAKTLRKDTHTKHTYVVSSKKKKAKKKSPVPHLFFLPAQRIILTVRRTKRILRTMVLLSVPIITTKQLAALGLLREQRFAHLRTHTRAKKKREKNRDGGGGAGFRTFHLFTVVFYFVLNKNK